MNKKLLIAAVGAALAAGSVAANAAATVYGKLNLGIASVSNGDQSTLAVTDDASRLGVKGDEDLGGGLKAIYTMEMAYDADGNTGVTGAARDVYAGLSGGWGSVRVGHFNSAYKNLSTGLEVMGDTIGDFTHTTFQGETREANVIGYTSPNINGFTFSYEMVRGETGDVGTTDESNPSIIAASYSMGPLYVGVGQRSFDNQSTASTAIGSATKIAASFAFGAFKVWVVNENANGDNNDAGDRATQHLGASFAMGNNTFAVTQTAYKQDGGDVADHAQMALAWTHALSKSTSIKVVNTTLKNDTGTSVGRIIGSNPSVLLTSVAAGDDVSGTQVQLSTSF